MRDSIEWLSGEHPPYGDRLSPELAYPALGRIDGNTWITSVGGKIPIHQGLPILPIDGCYLRYRHVKSYSSLIPQIIRGIVRIISGNNVGVLSHLIRAYGRIIMSIQAFWRWLL